LGNYSDATKQGEKPYHLFPCTKINLNQISKPKTKVKASKKTGKTKAIEPR